MTDGRVIGLNQYFLNDQRDGFDTLYIEPRTQPRFDGAGNFVGQWLVEDGVYQGDAGASNNILFWIERGVVLMIIDRSQESLEQTYDYMMTCLEAGDASVVPTEEQRIRILEEEYRRQSLPRLRTLG